MLPTLVTVNPMAKHRPKASHKRHHARRHYRAKNTFRTHHRHRRHRVHNPFSVKGLTGSVMPAVIGAGGAILTDVAMAYLPIPAALQSGVLNILTRAAVAVGVGYAAGAVAGKQLGKEVAAGGLIVVAYSGLKQALAPTLGANIKGLSGLADFGDYRAAIPGPFSAETGAMSGGGMGAYMNPRLGAYMQPRLGAYMNPAAFVGAGSPVTAKQRAFSGFGRFAGNYDYQQDEGAMM